MSVRGTLLFARYAYPPNELGYCGPEGAAALLRPDAPAEIARRARRFEGAWSYLEFIAASAGIGDPLDEAVVEAYWIGNELLDGVSAPDLVAWLGERFHGQPGGTWRTAGGRATPHHSFQVFEVYPWAGLLTAPGRAGRGVGAGPLPHPRRRGPRRARRVGDRTLESAGVGRHRADAGPAAG
nr:hypothetical protein GCM10020092_082530 [Actinoplanes digitatis]